MTNKIHCSYSFRLLSTMTISQQLSIDILLINANKVVKLIFLFIPLLSHFQFLFVGTLCFLWQLTQNKQWHFSWILLLVSFLLFFSQYMYIHVHVSGILLCGCVCFSLYHKNVNPECYLRFLFILSYLQCIRDIFLNNKHWNSRFDYRAIQI